jgi:hypothetical protein
MSVVLHNTEPIIHQIRNGKVDPWRGLVLGMLLAAREDWRIGLDGEAGFWLATRGRNLAEMMGIKPEMVFKKKKEFIISMSTQNRTPSELDEAVKAAEKRGITNVSITREGRNATLVIAHDKDPIDGCHIVWKEEFKFMGVEGVKLAVQYYTDLRTRHEI